MSGYSASRLVKKAKPDPLGLSEPPDAIWVPLQARGSPSAAQRIRIRSEITHRSSPTTECLRSPRARAQRREIGRPPVAMGEVLLSIELLPHKFALDRPAGHGRSEPNTNPSLPEPVGRPDLSMSLLSILNPLFWLRLILSFLLSPVVLLILLVVAAVALTVLGGSVVSRGD